MAPSERWRTDERSDDELFAVALVEQAMDRDDERYTWAIGTIMSRSSPSVLERGRMLTESDDAEERILGLNVLGNLLDPGDQRDLIMRKSVYLDETLAILMPLAERERDPEVLGAIAHALGQRYDPRALEPLLHLARHDDEDVRFDATKAMPGCAYMSGEDKPLTPEQFAHNGRLVDALIARCADDDGDVRDWALFGLAKVATDPDDGPERPRVRDTFAAHLDDEHDDAREEAACGLAALRDPRATAVLLERLQNEDTYPGTALLEAVISLADPRLLPALIAIRDEGFEDLLLPEAIAACSGEARGDARPG